MSLVTLITLIAGVVVLYIAWTVISTAIRFRGARVVTCPENEMPAGVKLDAGHCAATAFHPDLRLTECSRWPERQNCGQECLKQIAAAPEDCLVRNIVAGWYDGKSCIYCGKLVPEVHWGHSEPGLLGHDGKLVEWDEVSAERIHETLATAEPVCPACTIATRFTEQHPEIVLKRG